MQTDRGTKTPTLRLSHFMLERELGAGGYGVVYQALDAERNERVALKLLRNVGATALYHFKHEFRSLADIAHENLVALYELFCEDGQWFFTMELVSGCSFLEHAGGATDSSGATSLAVDDQTLPLLATGVLEPHAPVGHRGPLADPQRLRPALTQLVQGVAALHGAGKLHRDIKPANVLVTNQGRVVLLDFGLVTEIQAGAMESKICGTPHYMAPEQIDGKPERASDWYSVGVMLYEALTGVLPHPGRMMEVMLRKRTEDPVPPVQLVPSVSADLGQLCMRMLQRDPALRPSDEELLQCWAPQESPSVRLRAPSVMPTLLGREQERLALEQALMWVDQGQMVVVHVHGPSGVGKTTLVQSFVDDVELQREVVRLDGRCYEQELVPHKALDSMVDSLCDHLRSLSNEAVASLLPRNLSQLLCLFPVLGRVPAVRRTVAQESLRPDLPPTEQRRRAWVAFRELLARLGQRQPLVLVLDDAQWGDTDSAELLEQVLRPPDPPRLLLLVCYRREARQGNPFVDRLRALPVAEPESMLVDLPVDELELNDARALSLALLPRGTGDSIVQQVAQESGGNPFLLATLVHHLALGQQFGGGVSLEQALLARLDLLPATARKLLELVCVAGQPVDAKVALLATGAGETVHGDVRALRSAHLIRTVASDVAQRLLPYHDRIRETVEGLLDPLGLRSHHLQLARALEQLGIDDHELLAVHLEQAGEPARAAHHVRLAAERARDALAFDNAARLFRRALTLQPELDPRQRRQLTVQLAETLVDGQHGAEAAPLFMEAAQGAARDQELSLKQRAAEQWLKTGHIEQGRAVLQEVLDAFGIHLAATAGRAVMSLMRHRVRLWLRGDRITTRDTAEIAPELLQRIDLCWSGWTGLAMNDLYQAAELHCRNLKLSLEVGDPYRAARALAMEANFIATRGESTIGRTTQLLQRARALAETLEDRQQRHALGLVHLATGVCGYLQGQMRLVHDASVRAATLLRDLPGTYWELGLANLYAVEGLVHTGRIAELRQQLDGYLADATGRGDLFALLGMRVQGHLAHLAADDPDLARRMVEQGMAAYTDDVVRMPHYWEFYAMGQIQLYAGEPRLALEQVRRRWPGLKRAQLLRLQVSRIGAYYLRGRCAVAAAAGSSKQEAGALLRQAARDARRAMGERSGMARAKGQLVAAGVASCRGDLTRARRSLAQALELFEGLQMNHYAAAARLRLGQIMGDAEGQQHVALAEELLRSQGVRDPRRMVAMLAPGDYRP